MKKLIYLSSYAFADVDFPIIKRLKEYFDLYYIVIFGKQRSPIYSQQEVADYCNKNSVRHKIYTRKRRVSDFREIVTDYKVVREINNSKPDVIYMEFTGVFVPLLTKLLIGGKKTVYAEHDVLLHRGSNSLLEYVHHELVYKLFNNIQVFSKTQKDIFQKKYPRKRVFFVPLALKDFGQVTSKDLDRKEDKVNFLFFGSIRYNKGLDFLIKAANKLAREYDNFKVTIAGGCSQFDDYRRLIEKPEVFELDVRPIPAEEVPRVFARADIMVLPYRDVTQSGCLLTGYNYNVPPIASDFPGFREYITDGREGFLFESENVDALYECMKKIMQMSRKEIEQMKANVAEFVKKEIDIDDIVHRYVAFLNETADNN
ncbi:MAG: glycosyltransferase family 4 protein [Sedimentisphaerales bacterium]|jgi:glycosyltransferase involved in cell wall biosynthesis